MGGRRRRRRDHRDRRHGRRHRVAAVPRGRPPGPPRHRPRQLLLPARLAGAVHRPVRRAEDQADPALRRRAALDRHPARRDRLPRRPGDPGRHQAQDLADVRRRPGGRGHRRRRAVDLRHPQGAAPRGPRRLRRPPARPAVPRRRLDRAGTTCCAGCTTPREEVTVALVGKYIDLPDAYLSVSEALRAGGFAHEAKVDIRWIPSDECETPAGARHAPRGRRRDRASPAASASAASRASSARSPTPARTASRRSGCAWACSAW